MRPGTRAQHDRFCVVERWLVVRDAAGRQVRHHITYELPLDDGRRLRTRVSRPADATTYGPTLWKAVLRDQLVVTEAEFWACVSEKKLPVRSVGTPPPPAGLPAGLVHQLIHVAHVPEAEVMGMSREQAVERLAQYWTQVSGG